MRGKGRSIIVVGTSEGGLDALDALIGQLPTDLAAAIFIVQHMAPHNSGEALTRRLGRHQAFDAMLATDGQRFKPGRIYIAPPDTHLLLKPNTVLVRKGARENLSRPGVDPLFRSAAVAYGPRVIGVILTGMLDDGEAGLLAIKRCGGVDRRARPEGCRLFGDAAERARQPRRGSLRADFGHGGIARRTPGEATWEGQTNSQ